MKKTWKKITAAAVLVASLAITGSPAVAEGKGIKSISAARRAALKKVPSATVTEVDSDMENGVLVYDVELVKGSREYKLEYRSTDGKLMEYGWEIIHPAITNQNKKNLTKKTIKNKAKKQVKGSKILSTVLKYDDGMAQYEVKLKKGTKKYDLVYNSKTGKLLEYEWEIVRSGNSTATRYIGDAKAKKIALGKAPNATVVKVEFDDDDGVKVYEVTMVEGQYEYEVKIHAKTGKILEFEKEIDD